MALLVSPKTVTKSRVITKFTAHACWVKINSIICVGTKSIIYFWNQIIKRSPEFHQIPYHKFYICLYSFSTLWPAAICVIKYLVTIHTFDNPNLCAENSLILWGAKEGKKSGQVATICCSFYLKSYNGTEIFGQSLIDLQKDACPF